MTMAWLFPGQGSQRKGMGADVLDRYPQMGREADAILGYSIRDLCLEDSAPGLRDTRYVQPALFVVNVLSYLARLEEEPAPEYLAGHSLGEINALFAAGCFDFATGLRLVQRRGELMSQARCGGMLAVIGPDPDRLAEMLQKSGLDEIDLANRNSSRQVVLAGPEDALQSATQVIGAEGIGRCVPLPVSTPFHSRYLATAACQFAEFLDGVQFDDLRIPVIANVTGRPYPAGRVREMLTRQVASPVRWWESMSYLLQKGVTTVEEVGPGRVLTDLWAEAKQEPFPIEPELLERSVLPTVRPPEREPLGRIRPEQLGSAEFRADYGVRYAYIAGSMFKAISSTALVVRMGQAGLMGFFGAGGLTLDEIEAAIRDIRAQLGNGAQFGMNLLATPDAPMVERETVNLYVRHDVRYIEAASYTQITPGLVHFRFKGAQWTESGEPSALRHVLAKVSRPEVAAMFMAPAPGALVKQLIDEGALTPIEGEIACRLPVAGDICVEADSGGHTDGRSPYPLMQAIASLRVQMMAEHGFPQRIRVGAAGGLGSPASLAAAFVLGSDFVLTGSVNQCTAEAGISDPAKDLLADLDVQDTAYAPAGDLFEQGARVQVVRKGTLFAARANKLYQLYRQLDGLEDLDPQTRATIEEHYFRRSFDEVWEETKQYLEKRDGAVLERAKQNPKLKMALVFRWYFVHSTGLAMTGVPGEQVNYQIHCGPALGAFNRLVADSHLQPWRARHVDEIAVFLMSGAAELLDRSLHAWSGTGDAPRALSARGG